MEDGIIKIDTERAKVFNFTSNKFSLDSYLWKTNNDIYISLIHSLKPGKGSFSKLVKNILDAGYNCKVPTPLGKMPSILMHLGFTPTRENGCEVWIKDKI